ncbi:MAG: DUF2080 family transposase-associated protein [Candidatus Woesearchaeota archaeon]
MKYITKQVKRIGNGAYVTLPKETVGQTVTVIFEKTMQEVGKEALQILLPYLRHVKGIYLHGSYARGDNAPGSDIDLLVISDGRVAIPKRIEDYEIMSVTIQGLEKDLSYLAPLVLPAIKESIPILNEELLKPYRSRKLDRKNLRWYMESTQSALGLAESSLNVGPDHTVPVYSLVLRLRGLLMIDCMLNQKKYSTMLVNDFLKGKLSQEEIDGLNKIYQARRDNKAVRQSSVRKQSVIVLLNAVQHCYSKVRRQWERLS